MSASLPKGTRKTAADNRYEVAIHPRRTASMENSAPMDGRAMLMDAAMKGGKNELRAAIASTHLLVMASAGASACRQTPAIGSDLISIWIKLSHKSERRGPLDISLTGSLTINQR